MAAADGAGSKYIVQSGVACLRHACVCDAGARDVAERAFPFLAAAVARRDVDDEVRGPRRTHVVAMQPHCHARSTAVLATVHAESVHVWRLCLWLIPGLRTCLCLCPQASAVICDLRAWANEPCRRGATRSASCTTSRARARRRCAGRRSASTTSCAPRLTCSRRRRAPSLSGGMGTFYSLPRSDVALLDLFRSG